MKGHGLALSSVFRTVYATTHRTSHSTRNLPRALLSPHKKKTTIRKSIPMFPPNSNEL